MSEINKQAILDAYIRSRSSYRDFAKRLDEILTAQEGECSRWYLDNFMCAFCTHFGIDTSDWDMTSFLDDWLDKEGK
jgi:hypothetical protein